MCLESEITPAMMEAGLSALFPNSVLDWQDEEEVVSRTYLAMVDARLATGQRAARNLVKQVSCRRRIIPNPLDSGDRVKFSGSYFDGHRHSFMSRRNIAPIDRLKGYPRPNSLDNSGEARMNKIISLTGEVFKTFQSIFCQFFRLRILTFGLNNLGPDAGSRTSIGRTHYGSGRRNGNVEKPHNRFLHEKVNLAQDRASFADCLKLLGGQGDRQWWFSPA
jgi:hypothetical protein